MVSKEAEPDTISDDENQRLNAERVKLVYENSPVALVATLINSAALGFILRNAISHEVLAAWLLCVVLIAFGRYIQYRRFLTVALDRTLGYGGVRERA